MPHNLYDKSLYRFDEPQPSYWEDTAAPTAPENLAAAPLVGDHTCDVAVIGGGYTGMSAALHLARDHGIDVRVLEAGHIGWGASGRNGGFCTIGGTMLSPKAHIRRHGLDEARHYYRTQVEAVELVRDLATDENIDYHHQGDGEFTVAESDAHFAALSQEAEMKREQLGLDVRMIPKDEFQETGYDAPHQHGAEQIRPSFALHPLRYIRGLARAAEHRGANVHPHSKVVAWEKNGTQHTLRTTDGCLTARRVIVAGNGFMPEHLKKPLAGRALPIQSAIIVTRPLTEAERQAHNWTTENPAVNSRNLYNYYRMLPDHRLMIGGRGDCIGNAAGVEKTRAELKAALARLWPRWQDVDITHHWRGLVCFSSRLTPQVGRFPDDPSVYFGFAYHGNGVNTATWTGREIARWLAGGNTGDTPQPDHLPAAVRGLSSRVPFAALRKHYVCAGVAWHRLKDQVT